MPGSITTGGEREGVGVTGTVGGLIVGVVGVVGGES